MANNKRLERLILAALMTALITVLTIVVAIPVPIVNGYVHLGDSMVFLAVLLLGWKYGAVAAAFGSAFADLYLGYVFYAPWTFVIKGGMALLMGLLIHEGLKSKVRLLSSTIIVAALWILFNLATQYITRNHGEMQMEIMLIALLIPILLVVVAFFISRRDKIIIPIQNLVGMTGGGLFMVFGYFIVGGVMYGNFVVSAVGIPPNIIQFIVGFVISALVYAALAKTPLLRRSYYGQ